MEERLKSLFEEFWAWRLQDSPEFATLVGSHKFDAFLDDTSLASFENRLQYSLFEEYLLIILSHQF